MKNLLTVFLTLVFLYSFGQVDYIELPECNREEFSIHHVYEDGLILASTEYPRELFISTDKGDSWQKLEISEIETLTPNTTSVQKSFDRWAKFDTDESNYHFFCLRHDIYKIDKSNSKVNLHYTIEDNFSSLRDFKFLSDGNLLVAEFESLKLYDTNLNLLKIHNWGSREVNIMHGDDDNILTAVVNSDYSNELLTFDNDLTNTSTIPFHDHSGGVYYSENRIFLTVGYSIDGGISLEDYNLPGNSQINSVIVKDNRVVLVSEEDDIAYISIDSGNTFEEMELDPRIKSNSLDIFPDEGIYYTVLDVDDSYLWLSEDNGNTYTEYNLSLGYEYANNVVVDNTGYLIASNHENIQAYDPFTSNWEILKTDSCNFTKDLLVQENGSFICGECITHDGGKNWEFLAELKEYSIHQKNDILYNIDFSKHIRRSSDYGLSWQSDMYPDGFLISYDYIIVTANGDLITEFSPCFSCSNEVWYNFIDGGSILAEFPSTPSIYRSYSAYSSSEVYFVVGNNLFVSVDGYSNPTQVTIPFGEDDKYKIYTDFLNNVYLYTAQKVFVSNDLGTTWEDISPEHDDLVSINSITLGRDLHYYISTFGTSVLKSADPIGSLNVVEVLLFEDSNMNCEYDQDELVLEGFEVELNDRVKKVTNSSSSIKFNTISLENELNVAINTDIYDVCDYDNSVVFTSGIDNVIRYIPVTIKKECSELEVNGTTPFLRRCFENSYFFDVKNTGSVVAEDVEVDVLLDEYFEFISSDAVIISQSGQELKVSIDNIPPNSSQRFKVKFLLSCDAEFGEAHYMNASVGMENPCYDENVSMSFECRENIGSYDPNDKQAFVDGVSNIDVLGEGKTLEYLIRFQNTGTDTAFTVRVEDRFTSAFDLATLEIVSASHDYMYELDRRNLIVTFNNILLPDSTINEEASHGFVKFKVDIVDGFEKGDVFNNKADIFFDFNDPIRTNTTLNYYLCKHESVILFDTICPGENSYGFTEQGFYSGELQSHLGCDSIWELNLIVREELAPECISSALVNLDSDLDISVYPNPTNGRVYINIDGFNFVSGRLLLPNGQSIGTYNIENNQFNIDGPNGIYFIELTTENGLVAIKKIVLLK